MKDPADKPEQAQKAQAEAAAEPKSAGSAKKPGSRPGAEAGAEASAEPVTKAAEDAKPPSETAGGLKPDAAAEDDILPGSGEPAHVPDELVETAEPDGEAPENPAASGSDAAETGIGPGEGDIPRSVQMPGSTAAPEAARAPEVAATPEPVKEIERVVEKRGGFGAAFLGGLVAAGLGFLAGQADLLDPVLPAGLKSQGASDRAALAARQDELQATLADLRAEAGSTEIPDIAPLNTRLDELAARLEELAADGSGQDASEALGAEIQALAGRIGEVEKRPVTESVSPEAVAAYEAELERMRDSLAEQRGEVEQMLEEARAMDAASAEAARIASAQTMVARLRSALDSGSGYAPILAELSQAGVEAPAALAGPAEGGVPTLSALQDAYDPAARAALASAREETKGSGGLMAYVERHLGARSVAPRDGDDPDAVLSRAGAAVDEGRIADALAELEGLPDTARAQLADWEAAARTRLAAIAAADELAQSLNAT